MHRRENISQETGREEKIDRTERDFEMEVQFGRVDRSRDAVRSCWAGQAKKRVKSGSGTLPGEYNTFLQRLNRVTATSLDDLDVLCSRIVE